MSDTTVMTDDGRTTVSTGNLRTVWRTGDDNACACQVATLHLLVLDLQAENERLREERDEAMEAIFKLKRYCMVAITNAEDIAAGRAEHIVDEIEEFLQ